MFAYEQIRKKPTLFISGNTKSTVTHVAELLMWLSGLINPERASGQSSCTLHLFFTENENIELC